MPLGGFPDGDLELRTIDVAGRAIRFRAHRAPELLVDQIDAAAFAKDDRMPYWAELWPAAQALAAHVCTRVQMTGADVIELGAGLGIPGIAAALAGARSVMFTDYFEEALAFAAENARLNGVERFETQLLDWRRPALPRRYEVVIGSDLLYETRNQLPLATAISAALAPGGAAWIADPGRRTAVGFEAMARLRGLDVVPEVTTRVEKSEVTIFRVGFRSR